MAKQRKPAAKAQAPEFFSTLSPVTQDLLSIGLLYVLCLLVFHGIIFDNAAFATQGDTAAAMSYVHAGQQLEKAEGVDVLWMPYFFSGMPTFGNVAFVPHDVSYVQSIVQRILNILFLNGTWTWYIVYYFLAGVFMFFLGRTWGFGRIASMLAAVTYMLAPYAIGLAPDGHGSKLMAISYIPLVILLTHWMFEKRTLLTFGLLAAAIGTLLLTNHMQIVYYAFLVLGAYLLYHIILDFKEHKGLIPKKTLLLVGALLLGLCISSYIYFSVYEYSQYSMRGGGTTGATGGLTYDYATNWSWSLWDGIGLFIPGFYGLNGVAGVSYWGHVLPWTYSYIYVGLLPILLAVLAVMYKRTTLTIFMTILTVFVIVASLGRNFPPLYDLMFKFLPFFNKFRVPSMILHLLPLTLGILGAIGYTALEERWADLKSNTRLIKTLIMISLVAGGVLLLSLALKGSIEDMFRNIPPMKEGEVAQIEQRYGRQASQAIAYLKDLRFEIFWKDYMKFFALLAAGTGVIALYLRRAISPGLFAASMIAVLVIDLTIVDLRMINPQPAGDLQENFQPDETVNFLKRQQGEFRVLPLPPYGNEWNDNTYAYHGIESVGGYSPAKLRIYQTMLDSCLVKGYDPSFPLNLGVIDMLNAKYFIVPGQLPEGRFQLVHVDQAKRLLTYYNPGALPRAWFVDTVKVVSDDHDVFTTLDAPDFNPRHLAVVQSPVVAPAVERPDSGATAAVKVHQSRRIVIDATTSKPALLVVSEIYYPAGWKATVDGNPTEIYRTNSVLRSVVVPAGTHEVVMTFDPPLYRAGYLLSNGAWGVALVCILVGLYRDRTARERVLRFIGIKGKTR
jgi:hypothetical protein